MLSYEMPERFHRLVQNGSGFRIVSDDRSQTTREHGIEMNGGNRALWLVLGARFDNPRFVIIDYNQLYDRAQVAPDDYWIPIAHVQLDVGSLYWAPLRSFIPAVEGSVVVVYASNPMTSVNMRSDQLRADGPAGGSNPR